MIKMKKIIFILLVIASFTVFAQILLKGRPVVLIPAESYYTFPPTYTPTAKYHFVEIGSDERICFLNVQPQLAPLDRLRITIKEENKRYLWYCYRYDPRYFTMDY